MSKKLLFVWLLFIFCLCAFIAVILATYHVPSILSYIMGAEALITTIIVSPIGWKYIKISNERKEMKRLYYVLVLAVFFLFFQFAISTLHELTNIWVILQYGISVFKFFFITCVMILALRFGFIAWKHPEIFSVDEPSEEINQPQPERSTEHPHQQASYQQEP